MGWKPLALSRRRTRHTHIHTPRKCWRWNFSWIISFWHTIPDSLLFVPAISTVEEPPPPHRGTCPGLHLGEFRVHVVMVWKRDVNWSEKDVLLAGYAAHVWIPGLLFARSRPLKHFCALFLRKTPHPHSFCLTFLTFFCFFSISFSIFPPPVC